MARRSRPCALLLLLAAAGLAAGCGGGGTAADAPAATAAIPTTTAEATATTSASGEPAPRGASTLPSVGLTDVGAGGTVDLASLVPAERPLLLWFWAPH